MILTVQSYEFFPNIANYFRTYYYFSGAEIVFGGAEI